MTHIAVERNRRRLMNDHLASLASLIPSSYIYRVSHLLISEIFELPLSFLLRYLPKILHTPLLLSVSFFMLPVQQGEAPVSQSLQ
jgi:hypothetical protein